MREVGCNEEIVTYDCRIALAPHATKVDIAQEEEMSTHSPHLSFLDRTISRHLREFHCQNSSRSGTGGISRRTFLQSATSTAGLALWKPQLAEATQGRGMTAEPKPIVGGNSPFGIFIHHFPALPTGTPLQSLNDPSQITDFKGFVGLNRIRGAGRGSGFADPVAFQADVGFMKGAFIGEDGKHHEGAFGFI